MGAPLTSLNDRDFSGSAYVIFGKASNEPVDLAQVGSEGYRIDGATAPDSAGWAVSEAGDVNGDGTPDVVVGAPSTYWSGSGAAFVVFGKETMETVGLADLGDAGFRMTSAVAGELVGSAVSSAGDFNGDGLGDVAIGAPSGNRNGRRLSGCTYISYGRDRTETVELDDLGGEGLRIDWARAFDRSGFSLSGAGDTNGDGLSDLLIGAPFASRNGRNTTWPSSRPATRR